MAMPPLAEYRAGAVPPNKRKVNQQMTSAESTSDDSDRPFPDWPDADERERQVLRYFAGDPLPLREGDLPPFPTDTLPGPYAAMVGATAAALQVDTAMVGPMVLGALSAACGGCVEAEVNPDWTEIAVLHQLISAGPSERKSTTMGRVTAPLYAAQKGMMEAAAGARAEALARQRIAVQRAQNAEREASKITQSGKPVDHGDLVDPIKYAVDLAAKAAAIDVPALPRLLGDDMTPEALVERMATNRGRLAVMSAEGGVLATMAGRYSNGVPNLDGWLKGYFGEDITVDRKGHDPMIVEHPALTVCLAVQPDLMADVRANRVFEGRGLLSRLAIVQPRSMLGRRDPKRAVPTPEHVTVAYAAALTDLARRLHERDGGPVAVKFNPAAGDAIEDIGADIEQRTINGNLSGDLASWGGKHAGRIVRIALLLHMAEHGAAGADLPVSADTVAAARRIGEFFAAHSRAAYGVADTDGVKMAHLVAMMNYLWKRHERRPLTAIPVRQIGKTAPDALRRKTVWSPVLGVLVDLHLITRRFDKGGAPILYVHPKADPRLWAAS